MEYPVAGPSSGLPASDYRHQVPDCLFAVPQNEQVEELRERLGVGRAASTTHSILCASSGQRAVQYESSGRSATAPQTTKELPRSTKSFVSVPTSACVAVAVMRMVWKV